VPKIGGTESSTCTRNDKMKCACQKGRHERGKTPRNVGNEPTTQTRTIWRWQGAHRDGNTNTAPTTFVPVRQENRGLAQHLCG
jgi:hypothetical protein